MATKNGNRIVIECQPRETNAPLNEAMIASPEGAATLYVAVRSS